MLNNLILSIIIIIDYLYSTLKTHKQSVVYQLKATTK